VIDKAITGRFIQASAQVAQPGLIETVPAGVFFGPDSAARTSQLDLTLVGPDQVNRFKYDHKAEHAERYVSLGRYHTDC
jgi:hypothetical protein